jgi:hypothetical protein
MENIFLFLDGLLISIDILTQLSGKELSIFNILFGLDDINDTPILLKSRSE